MILIASILIILSSKILNKLRVSGACSNVMRAQLYDFLGEGANAVAIYDPVKDKWTVIAPPPFFINLYPPRAACPRDLTQDHLCAPSPIADGQEVLLSDGTYMQADKMSTQAALLDLQTMTW